MKEADEVREWIKDLECVAQMTAANGYDRISISLDEASDLQAALSQILDLVARLQAENEALRQENERLRRERNEARKLAEELRDWQEEQLRQFGQGYTADQLPWEV